MGDAGRRHDAELGQVTAQGVDRLGTLPHEEIPRPVDHCRCLLCLGPDRDEPHRRTRCRFGYSLGIGRIALLPLHERLHVGRRDQLHGVPELSDRACPVMGAGAGLHRDCADRLLREEGQDLPAPQLAPEDDRAVRGRPVHLENVLRQIHPDDANLDHGRPPL